MITIRPCEDHHYDAIVLITNATQPEPTTAAEMRRSDRMLQAMEGFTLIRVVAELETGEVAGYGFTESAPWSPRTGGPITIRTTRRCWQSTPGWATGWFQGPAA